MPRFELPSVTRLRILVRSGKPKGEATMATPTVDPRIKLLQLPTRELGLENVPAFPIDTAGMLDTLFRLGIRFKQREQALEGLSKTYTIGGKTARARDFRYWAPAARPCGGSRTTGPAPWSAARASFTTRRRSVRDFPWKGTTWPRACA
jgi:hypothetical protein